MTMFDGVRAVLFDLDGTLIDSTELILASHEYTFQRHLAGRCPDRPTLVRTMGRSLFGALEDIAAGAGAADPAATAREMIETYRAFQRVHEVRLMKPVPGMNDVLADLAARGYIVGMVTSKTEVPARRSLEWYGLGPLLSVSVFHDDTERHKPLPDPLIEAARRGGFNVDDAVYVGDSTHDMLAGRAAGMKTIAALWGPYTRADLDETSPDAFADTPAELLGLLPSRAGS
jgi:pyrophosphatase PpaX